MNMLDVENRLAKMRSLRDRQIEKLKREHRGNEEHMKNLSELNERILDKISRLEQERDNDQNKKD